MAPYVQGLPDAIKKNVKAVIGTGRKAVGMVFIVLFAVRVPAKEKEHRRRAVTWRRSLAAQGNRHVVFWERQCARECQFRTSPYRTVDERVENDKLFRKRLARKVVGCKSNPRGSDNEKNHYG